MTETKPPDEPAFPHQEKQGDGTHWQTHEGMSLRDYFAGAALIAMGTWTPSMPDGQAPRGHAEMRKAKAAYAYAQADAMLKERGR